MDHAGRSRLVRGRPRPRFVRTRWIVGGSGLALLLLGGIGVAPRMQSPAQANSDARTLALGRTLYAAHCASCHGVELEGQPDWQVPNPDGTLPAPPHSAEGHTWHHPDALLFDYVKRGGGTTLAEMGVEFRSGMPAFEEVLTDREIRAVLDFIKSTWPEDIRAAQEAVE